MKWRQVAWRIWYRLRPRPGIAPRPAAGLRALSGAPAAPGPAGILSPGPSFAFLGRTVEFADGIAWRDPARARLWNYNLHYFDYLGDAASPGSPVSSTALVHDWIRANPPGVGDGWEPYPTSLRVVNWLRWMLACRIEDPVVAQSLCTQVRWLERHLEHHIRANHLFANAKALSYAGLAFGGADGERWLRLGGRLVERELAEQVLPDGGHYERSPMYHATIMADVLDLVELGALCPAVSGATVDEGRALVARMSRWLALMTHPDGGPAFFNDAALGIAPTLRALCARAKALGVALPDLATPAPSAWLRDSGYVRLVAGRAVALFDAAPVGPDHQPGHAHADSLSFELSVDDERVIVNSGTSTYAEGAERSHERSTAAHNTVEIDDLDSSEVWAAFRVARRARPRDVRVDLEAGEASAAHDGYLRLAGRVLHSRTIGVDVDGVRIVDALSGSWHRALARYHFHPRFDVTADGPTHGRLLVNGRGRFGWRASGGTVRIEPTLWRPRFGERHPNLCLSIDMHGPRASFELVVETPRAGSTRR